MIYRKTKWMHISSIREIYPLYFRAITRKIAWEYLCVNFPGNGNFYKIKPRVIDKKMNLIENERIFKKMFFLLIIQVLSTITAHMALYYLDYGLLIVN